MLKLKPSDITVPDGFSYRFPQDGVVKTHNVRAAWFEAIDRHYKDNRYEQPENWRELAEDQLCRHLSGEWCSGGTPHSFVSSRFTLDDFIRGTKVLGSFALSSAEVVPSSQAEQRALICSRCPVNFPVPGCSACSKMADVVATAKGARGTKYDHLLRACGICHCANEAAVWVPIEFLAKGITPDMEKTYAEIDAAGECWKIRELVASREHGPMNPAYLSASHEDTGTRGFPFVES